MTTSLAVLMVEDSESDGQLIVHALKKGGDDVVSERVETAEQMRAALGKRAWDIVISDYSLPRFDGRAALTLLQETGQDIPFIVVSGAIGEETAVAMLKAGAHDYLLKGNLARLAPAVERELAQAETRRKRKQAEQALREREQQHSSIYDTVADVIFQLAVEKDGRYRFASVNQAFLSVTGLDYAQVVSKRVDEIIPEPSLTLVLGKYGEAIREKRIVRWEETSEYPTGRLTGEVSVAPVFDDAGHCTHLVGAVHDITERKRAEAALAAKNEELRAMTQQLWQAAKLATMGELAASIAHELNNPLATVSLRVEGLLGQAPANDPARRALEVIEQEVERMSTLVASLLQFSRRSAPQISTLDVREEIENTLELVHYLLRQRQITVQREFAPEIPMVQADRQQLRQLFLNLFTNAGDAMPQGGTLTIRVSAAPAQHRILIEIADTGTGIAPEDLAKVMEPFFTTKPEGKGTGLGLAICRRIVQEHNGTFEITSAGPGQGATVRLTLPGKNESNGAFLREA